LGLPAEVNRTRSRMSNAPRDSVQLMTHTLHPRSATFWRYWTPRCISSPCDSVITLRSGNSCHARCAMTSGPSPRSSSILGGTSRRHPQSMSLSGGLSEMLLLRYSARRARAVGSRKMFWDT
jgi:hypothetical protein